MADNVTLPGTGETVATKEISGVEFQKIMLTDENGNVMHPNELIDILKLLLNGLMYPSYVDRSLNKIKVDVQAGAVTASIASAQTLATLTTCTTVTGLTNIDSYQGKMPVLGIDRIGWNQCCRTLIT